MKIFDVDVIRSAVSGRELRFDDLDNKLIGMGLCNACATDVAPMYVDKPKSKCAAVTRKALEGDPEALKTLQEDPASCTYQP